jgi:beta-lactam-binding protein with PASTA domain
MAGTFLQLRDTVTLRKIETTVPNVVGQSLIEARQALEKKKLVARLGEEFLEGDKVFEQHPPLNTPVIPFTQVDLLPGVVVPSITDLPVEQALQTLAQFKLTAQEAMPLRQGLANNPGQQGRIVVYDQRPPADTLTPRDRPIEYGLLRQVWMVAVPNLVGRTFEQADAILRQSGLKGQWFGKPVDRPTWDFRIDGVVQVRDQDPVFGGDPVELGSTVWLTFERWVYTPE